MRILEDTKHDASFKYLKLFNQYFTDPRLASELYDMFVSGYMLFLEHLCVVFISSHIL